MIGPAAPAAWRPRASLRALIGLHVGALPALLAWPGGWVWIVAALLAGHGLLLARGHRHGSELLGPSVARLAPAAAARREVALTFDDGPDPTVTPRVLDLLDRHGARASFFVIGRRAARHPELVRDIARRGHRVENHSQRHRPWFACLTLGATRRDVTEAQATLTAILAGVAGPPAFFRAPIGLRSPLLEPVLAGCGLRHAGWSRRGLDGVSGNAPAVLRRLTRDLAGGDVLLLHDGGAARTPAGAPVVLEVLPALLDVLAARGLRGVPLSADPELVTLADEARGGARDGAGGASGLASLASRRDAAAGWAAAEETPA